MDAWNGLDFFIFLIFASNTILGMVRGAIREIISMMCLSVALIFMIKFTVPLARFCNSSPLISNVVNNSIMQNFMQAIGAGPITPDLLYQIFYSLSLLICFMFPFSLCEGALSHMGVMEMYTFPYVVWDRKVGGALGCIRGYVFSLLFIVVLTLHIFAVSTAPAFLEGSFFINLFKGSALSLDHLVSAQQPEKYNEIYKGKDLYKANEMLEKMGTDLLPAGNPPPNNQSTPTNTKK